MVAQRIDTEYQFRDFGSLREGLVNQCSDATNIEPHREKTGFLPMRKQSRRSASR